MAERSAEKAWAQFVELHRQKDSIDSWSFIEEGLFKAGYEALLGEMERCENAYCSLADAIEQTLGKALGYPPYPEEWGTTDVCVGDHTPESLVTEAARCIGELQARVQRLDRLVEVMGI